MLEILHAYIGTNRIFKNIKCTDIDFVNFIKQLTPYKYIK